MLYITTIPINTENIVNQKYIENSKLSIKQCLLDNQEPTIAFIIQIMY